MSEKLLPVEELALAMARAQIDRGENPPINTTTVLVMTLERLSGRRLVDGEATG